MNQRIFGAMVVFLTVLQPALAMNPHQPGSPSVVIDAAYGGVEDGPLLNGPVAAKDFTLDVAMRTAALLKNHGVTAHLTRQADETLSPGERLRRVRSMGGDIVVQMQAGSFGRTCISVQAPQSLNRHQTAGQDINEYMMDQWRESQTARSSAAAAAITRFLQNKGVELCGTASGAPDPVLDQVVQPVVIVVVKIASTPQKGTGSASALQDSIAEGIALGLADVLSGMAAK